MRRELKRRSAIEPVIGHMKNDGRLGRNFLAGRIGDAVNALLCGAGYNLRLILNYLAETIWPSFCAPSPAIRRGQRLPENRRKDVFSEPINLRERAPYTGLVLTLTAIEERPWLDRDGVVRL